MDEDNPIFKAIKLVLVAGYLGLFWYFWTYLEYLDIQERLLYTIIIGVILYVIVSYVEKEIDKKLLKSSDTDIIRKKDITELLKDKHDVFIAYYSGGGINYARHLWNKLPDVGYVAFYNEEDIPKRIRDEEVEEWRSIIDKAILRSDYLVLIMTLGFNERPELLRELDVAKKNNIDRIYFKHYRLANSKMKVILADGELDLSNVEYTTFKDEYELFNELGSMLGGQKDIPVEGYTVGKREIMTKILRPLYSEIEIIIRDITELSSSSFTEWNKIGLYERYLWNKFDNESLKEKIESFYSIMMKRKDDLGIYESLSKHIINTNVKEFTDSRSLKYSNARDIVLLEVKTNIIYKNKRVGQGNLILFQDLVYRKLKESLERVNRIESFSITNIFIHLSGETTYEPSQEEFEQLWTKIIMDSDNEPIIVFLRSSVNLIQTLGKEILQLIDKY